MAMVFMDPSLRTRASFEAAMFLHGGHGIVLEPGRGSWSMETEPGAVMDQDTVEHLVDAARVLGRYADVVGLRSFPRGTDWSIGPERRRPARLRPVLREAGDQHGIGSAASLPAAGRCADAQGAAGRPARQTLRADLGLASQRRLPTAVPASAALAAAHLGMEIVIARPTATSWIRKTPRWSGRSPSIRVVSSSTSSTIPTKAWSEPTPCM